MIVSDIAGTTRDAIDTDITYDGKEYVFIDTAGLRPVSYTHLDVYKRQAMETVLPARIHRCPSARRTATDRITMML